MRDSADLFQDIPWEIVTDDSGEVIGEVFVLLPDPDPLRNKPKSHGGTPFMNINDRSNKRTKGELLYAKHIRGFE